MSKYYYVTAASTEKFIKTYTRYAVGSLFRAGIDPDDIHVIGNDKRDKKLILKYIPALKHAYHIDESLKGIVWKYSKGSRKYSLFKAAALHKVFTDPIADRRMIYFDGDVLWYKNPENFFNKYNNKTWFHHGKSLEKRAVVKKETLDLKSYKSLKKWCSEPMAYLMAKHGIKKVPLREVVAGLYMLHPRDHKEVLRLTYEFCVENKKKFSRHEGGGDQKPMNAALNVLGVDWHGGSRFMCPEHKEYFDHFFGKDDQKRIFHKRAKRMQLL